MSTQRYSNNNDNFEFKGNTKSTPRKAQNYNEAPDKSPSIDAIYSEVALLKEDNSHSICKFMNNFEDIESRFRDFERKIETLSKSHNTIENLESRLYKLEESYKNVKELRTNYENLESKVNELANNVSAINLKNQSPNTIEDTLKSHITDSFAEIKLSLHDKMSRLDNILKHSQPLNVPLTNQISTSKNYEVIADKGGVYCEPEKGFPELSTFKVKENLILEIESKEKVNKGVEDSSKHQPTLISETSEPTKPLSSNFAFSGPKDSSLFANNSPSKPTPLFGGLTSLSSNPSGGGTFGTLFAGLSTGISSNVSNVKSPTSNFDFMSTASDKNSVFGAANSNLPSFSFLASGDKQGFGQTSEVTWKAGSKLFSTTKADTKINTSGNADNADDSVHNEEEEHDPHFQPIIELPPLIAVGKDEESYEVLFKDRCKLYRFINQEWKERGVGEMKILKTKTEINPSRPVILLMRRDQVRKICCNQRVTKAIPFFAEMGNAKSTCWVGYDMSEGVPAQEKFAIRFSHVEVLTNFKSIISKIQDGLTSEETAQ